MAEDKGFKPSKKKIDQARIDGQVLKSQFASQSATLFVSLIAGLATVRLNLLDFKMLLEYSWSTGMPELELIGVWGGMALKLSAPPLCAAVFAAFLIESWQVGLKATPVTFKADRLNPVSGGKRTFETLKEIWLLCFKVIVLSLLVYLLLERSLEATVREYLGYQSVLSSGLRFITILIGAFSAFSLIEYGWARRKFMRELSMSRDELIREHKEEEGDPQIKAERKALHQQLLMQEVIKRVRKSKAIIVEKA